ncbi:MAG: hypothetical protein PHY23_10370 [Oscillospiraceae bacterium]|nr:hypothetical protein [Oscillospiraceae bacterium]
MARKNSTLRGYAVLIDFTEPGDGMHIYRAGKDRYPRPGYDPPDERIAYLQSDKTVLCKPVIAKK